MLEESSSIEESPRSSENLTDVFFEVESEPGSEEGTSFQPCGLCRVSGVAIIFTILILAVICFPLCFILFYESQDGKIEVKMGVQTLPTLSLTGGYWPNSAIFTLFLHIYSFLSIILFSMVTNIFARRIESLHTEKDKGPLLVANKTLFVLAMVFSLFLLLTGTIVVVESNIIHAVVAIIMFVAGVLHICVFTFTIGHIRAADRGGTLVVLGNNFAESLDKSIGLRWQFAAFLLAVPVNVVALLTGFIVGLSCGLEDAGCLAFSVQVVVVVEYTTALALLLYIVGFLYIPEMSQTFCQVVAGPERKQ